jgi:hypothetical protein
MPAPAHLRRLPPPAAAAAGYLIPAAHKFYWMGYRALIWPNFQWLDPNTYSGYSHWGIYLPGDARRRCRAAGRRAAAAWPQQPLTTRPPELTVRPRLRRPPL